MLSQLQSPKNEGDVSPLGKRRNGRFAETVSSLASFANMEARFASEVRSAKAPFADMVADC